MAHERKWRGNEEGMVEIEKESLIISARYGTHVIRRTKTNRYNIGSIFFFFICPCGGLKVDFLGVICIPFSEKGNSGPLRRRFNYSASQGDPVTVFTSDPQRSVICKIPKPHPTCPFRAHSQNGAIPPLYHQHLLLELLS